MIHWLTRRAYINVLLFIVFVMLSISELMAYFQVQYLIQAKDAVIQTHHVIEQLSNTLMLLANTEAKVNSVVLSNEVLTSDSIHAMVRNIQRNLAMLHTSIQDNPEQQHVLTLLKQQLQPRLNFLNKLAGLQSAQMKQQVAMHVSNAEAKKQNQDIIITVQRMIQDELSILSQRQKMTDDSIRLSNLLVISSALLGLSLLLLCLILLNYHLTKLQYMEREREDTETRLKIIIDNSADLIAALDLNYCFLAFNAAYEKAFKKAFGVKIKLGMSIQEALNNTPNHEAMIDIWHRALVGDEFTIVTSFDNDTDNRRFYEASYSTIRNAYHQRIGASHIMRDITERKKVDNLKNEFVSVVSHELRTPLTSIRGALALVLGHALGEVNEKTRHILQIAHHNCERLEHLINDILDIEKIESDKMEFQSDAFNLNEFAEEAVESNRMYAESFHVSLRLELSPQQLRVKADYHRLMQVLSNLLSNAIKFSPPDSQVSIIITKHSETMARVSVVDHGEGVPDDFRQHIFEKFSQADAAATRRVGGSGLGLNISRAMMKKMGGTLDFTSTPLHGATFYFDIPLTNDMSTKIPARINVATTHQKLRILYLEDDNELAEIVERMLHQEAIVTRVPTLSDALSKLASQTFDVALLDYKLAEGDSVGLFPELTKKQIPIVVFTAYDLPKEIYHQVNKVLIKSKTTSANLISALHDVVSQAK